jgi:PAS domain S-box-containing protein
MRKPTKTRITIDSFSHANTLSKTGGLDEDARERFLLAVQGANDGLWDWNIATGEVYYSPRWKEMLGYTDQEISNHADEWIKRIHPDDRKHALATIRRHLKGDSAFYHLEHRVRHKDGTYRWFLARGNCLRDANGQPTHLSGRHTDISERKQAEEQLEQLVEQRTKELSLLLQVAHTVASTLERQPLLNAILEQLKVIVDYSEAALLSIQQDRLTTLDYRGAQTPAQMEKLVLLLERSPLYSRIYQQRETIIMDDLHADQRFIMAYKQTLGDESGKLFGQVRSWMGVPLIANERVIGIVTLNHARPYFYTPRHASLAFALANQAAIALENARLYEQAQALAALQERQRLARELHDSVSQELYGISLSAHCAREALATDPGEAIIPLEHVILHVETAVAEMRALLFELRPESLEIEGLVAALEKQVALMRSRYHLAVGALLQQEPDLPAESKHTLYRIAQEALHNVIKHAQATTITLRLTQENHQLLLEIRDDGRGFEPAASFPGHLGLRSMQERATHLGGTLTITSAPGRGTSICVRISTPTTP